jgi:tartrate dehydratase alpha subunit/fumarate hydratase class I-like protein
MLNSKLALLRPIGSRNPDAEIEKLELSSAKVVNGIGIGTMGLGADTTVLDIHTKINGNPHRLLANRDVIRLLGQSCRSCRTISNIWPLLVTQDHQDNDLKNILTTQATSKIDVRVKAHA